MQSFTIVLTLGSALFDTNAALPIDKISLRTWTKTSGVPLSNPTAEGIKAGLGTKPKTKPVTKRSAYPVPGGDESIIYLMEEFGWDKGHEFDTNTPAEKRSGGGSSLLYLLNNLGDKVMPNKKYGAGDV
ncbi:uncharacterized protein N0V89_009925 [Didymosphaeria variabile]|uniref:Uncharacterized protein n=1 Tax=Didymosphaeria variabile TaxID=1932322 RepID=A0A9W8XGJ3_9PLEO|nr:uncharacterized protein N0V89_009925 [Didymosphaeria variabile]KAJ4348548.1 hypothetical protein N0V89_009925 [Didymosphaeria variabile]